ncbi:MAG: hypothetical protein IJY42_01295 [Clostridia bacterium]|nr:hypothetical protein [Clostridia bacterium]
MNNQHDQIQLLWKKTKAKQEEICQRQEELNQKIKQELEELDRQKWKAVESEANKVSARARRLDENVIDLDFSLGLTAKSILLTVCLAITLAAFFVLLRLFLFPFTIVSEIFTYVVIAVLSIVFAILAERIYWMILDKKSDKDEEVQAWRQKRSEIWAEFDKKRKFTKEEKYLQEQKNIDEMNRENRYSEVKRQMIRVQHGNAIFFSFGRFGYCTAYDIMVDGVSTYYSSTNKFQMVKLNPGYHAIEIRFIYHSTTNGSVSHRECSWQLQAGEEDLPKFITFDRVDIQNGKMCEVSAEEFEKISGKMLI